MSENITISEFTINTFHIVCEILFYSLQYCYNHFILICAKKNKFKNSKLENTLCISFNTVSPVQFIYHELRYT